MFRLAFVLTLCFYGSLGYNIDHDLEAIDREWSRGMPATSGGAGGSISDCKKDMWIVWDNSQSIGENVFKSSARPFMIDLINNPQLNVGPEGTHIGILSFSMQKKTKVLLEMGEKQNPNELVDYLNSLNYEDLVEDGTRTGMALKIINEKLKKNSPYNYRGEASDVVMLFTDGQPIRRQGEDTFGDRYKSIRYGEELLANDTAKSLKNKGVAIVGLAVGATGKLDKFKGKVKAWSTEGKFFEASKDTPQTVLDELVSASCIDPGECTCDKLEGFGFAALGGKATITWEEPKLKCASGREARIESRDVSPNVRPPAQFRAGSNTVMYTYRYLRGTKEVPLKCPVDIFVQTCKCSPPVLHVKGKISSGTDEASVSWEIPKPNCEAHLTSVSPPEAKNGGGRYKIGEHEVRYHYQHSSSSGSFSLSCPVKIIIEGKLCGGVGYDASEICCCGAVHQIIDGYECCGHGYYDPKKERCEEEFTIVPI